jgi:type II secretory pathway pseudopilin PulG
MAIIAVLALLVVGAIIAARNAQTRTVHRSNASTTRIAIESYYVRNQSYPTTPTTATSAATLFGTGGILNGYGNINTTGTTCSNGGVTASFVAAGSSYTINTTDLNCTAIMETTTGP